MCRSANEPAGPRCCPSHAHAKFAADALAEVLALEARELATSHAHHWYRQAAREATQIRDEHGERDIDLADYRKAYRDMLAAKRAVEQTSATQRQASMWSRPAVAPLPRR